MKKNLPKNINNNTFSGNTIRETSFSYKNNNNTQYIELNSSHDSFENLQIFKKDMSKNVKKSSDQGSKNDNFSGLSQNKYKSPTDNNKLGSQFFPNKKEENSKKITEEKNYPSIIHNNSKNDRNNTQINKTDNIGLHDSLSLKNLYLAIPVPKVEVISSLQTRITKIESSVLNLPQVEELNEKIKSQNEKIQKLEESIKSYQDQSKILFSLIEENKRFREENSHIQNANDKLIKLFLGAHKLVLNIDQLISSNFLQPSPNNHLKKEINTTTIVKENFINQTSCFFCKQLGHKTSDCKSSSFNQINMELDN
jgi:hypothetical protein